MYILETYCDNLKGSGSQCVKVKRHPQNRIQQWTWLDAELSGQDLLRLMTLSVVHRPLVHKYLNKQAAKLVYLNESPLRVETLLALHTGRDMRVSSSQMRGFGFEVEASGLWRQLGAGKWTHLPANVRTFFSSGKEITKNFIVAYGGKPEAEPETIFEYDALDYLDMRTGSLLSRRACLTHPVCFFDYLRLKGIRYGREHKRHCLVRIAELAATRLQCDTSGWIDPDVDVTQAWNSLPRWKKNVLTVVLDMLRHQVDSCLRSPTPMDEPALFVFHRPHRFCPRRAIPAWTQMLAELFPKAQFIITLPHEIIAEIPADVRNATLPLPDPSPSPSVTSPARKIPRTAVALLDVDSRLPNLALMKIAGYFKQKNRRVERVRSLKEIQSHRGEIWASCIFNKPSSQRVVRMLQKRFGDDIQIGGSGVSLKRRLPAEIEAAQPDFGLYPELQDRAIGFLTRGCPCRCEFCVVPRKEGRPRAVAELDEVLQGRDKLILLDDNLLAHRDAPRYLRQMVERNIAVNFNQTLDIRFLNQETAGLLKRIRCSNVAFTRRCLHFSLNDTRNLERVRKQYELLECSHGDNVEFICMYGFNTTLAEDVERFRFLKSLPGAYVFVQEYQPIQGGPPPFNGDYFGSDPDPLIDELIGIIFRQNMKSMEKFYKWLIQKYARQFGNIHQPLVDCIFRYNNRWRKAAYVDQLLTHESTRPGPLGGLRSRTNQASH